MKNKRALWAATVVFSLGLALVTPPTFPLSAYGAEPAKYTGPKLCTACHKATHPEVIAAVSAGAHARAMWAIADADESHPLVGDFSGDPPFAKERVAYVLGVGRKYQSYLDADLHVLPAEWSVEDKAWRPREAVDATRDCLGCHTTGFDPETKQWAALGVTCEMCHGPGSTHVASNAKNETIARPSALEPERRAMICGQCHSHGKSKDGSLTFPRGYRPGDDLDQHFVTDSEVPKGAVNSQYNELTQSGTHLAAGTVCTTCHAAHGPVGQLPNQLRAPVNDICLNTECHGGKLAGAQHEPAALQAVTCAVCHMPGGTHVFAAPRAQ